MWKGSSGILPFLWRWATGCAFSQIIISEVQSQLAHRDHSNPIGHHPREDPNCQPKLCSCYFWLAKLPNSRVLSPFSLAKLKLQKISLGVFYLPYWFSLLPWQALVMCPRDLEELRLMSHLNQRWMRQPAERATWTSRQHICSNSIDFTEIPFHSLFGSSCFGVVMWEKQCLTSSDRRDIDIQQSAWGERENKHLIKVWFKINSCLVKIHDKTSHKEITCPQYQKAPAVTVEWSWKKEESLILE